MKKCNLDEFSEMDLHIIDSVLAKYGSMSGKELINITHEPNSLWSKVKNEHNLSFKDQKISDYTIDFTELISGDEVKLAIYNDAKENLILFGA